MGVLVPELSEVADGEGTLAASSSDFAVSQERKNERHEACAGTK